MTLQEFGRYAATNAGINAIAGFFLSFVAEWWPAYEKLARRAKRLVMLGLCLIIPVCGLAILVLFCGEALTADSVWAMLFAGGTAFLLSQMADLRNLNERPDEPITLDVPEADG